MDGSIRLTDEERKVLLKAYRSGRDRHIARRAHVLLLRADGRTWREIREVLYCSHDLISGTLRRFKTGGVAAVLEEDAVEPVASSLPSASSSAKALVTAKRTVAPRVTAKPAPTPASSAGAEPHIDPKWGVPVSPP